MGTLHELEAQEGGRHSELFLPPSSPQRQPLPPSYRATVPLPSCSSFILLFFPTLSHSSITTSFRVLQGPVKNTEEAPVSDSSNNGATSRIPEDENNHIGTNVGNARYDYQGGDETTPVVSSHERTDSIERVGSKHVIDTASPFESVKDAVSKFGGRIDWKSRRTQSLERSKLVGQEFAKTETVEELESTKKLIEELKINLERTEKEELQAKEEADLLSLKIEEMEEDIVGEASNEAKGQLEAEKARHAAAVSDLEFIKKEVETLSKEYAFMVSERDIAVQKAEEAVAESKEAEKALENLTNELIATKESLSSTRAAHLEAEEQRLGVVDEEFHSYKLELEQAEEELERMNQQVLSARVLKSRLDASSSLLHELKAELAAYMESKLKEEGDQERKKELEEVKLNIEKATAEVDSLREASMSLKSELEEEKSVLASLRHSEEIASAAVTKLQEELEKTRSAIAFHQMKEKEDRELMIELPRKLQEAAKEADEAKALAQAAQAQLLDAQEEAEQAKALASTLEGRLLATQKEIEAAKVSEKLARDAIKALEKTESGRSKNDNDSSHQVTLTLDEYQELSKRTYKAEEQANAKIAAANSQIEMAKESELRSLEKLEELNEELSVRRESLKIATENAEKAREGKLAVEQELRTWMAEQEEQQRKADELNDLNAASDADVDADADAATSPEDDLVFAKGKGKVAATGPAPAPDTKSKKKKKLKSLFPTKVVMFFSKRKTHPTK